VRDTAVAARRGVGFAKSHSSNGTSNGTCTRAFA
jgi:hypothetical protein